MQWVRSIVSLGRFVVARTGAGQESRRSIENKAPDANGRWTGTSRRPTEVRTHARSGGDDTAPTTDSAFDRDQGSPAQLRASYSVRLRGHHPDQINGGTTSAGSNHGNRNDGGGTSGLVHLQSRRAGMQVDMPRTRPASDDARARTATSSLGVPAFARTAAVAGPKAASL